MTRSVVVVGAGIAGLAVAWHLQQGGVHVTVLEASERPGGVVRSLREGSAVLEQGPQSLRATGGATARLVEGLGLVERVRGPSAAAKRRFLLVGGRLRTPGSLLFGGPAGWWTLLRAMGELWVSSVSPEGESVRDFVARRFGAGMAEPFVDAFVAGIYAGDARRLEAASAFPDLVLAERRSGSVLRGLIGRRRERPPAWMPPGGTFTFDGGVQVLTDRLADSLGASLRLGVSVVAVHAGGGRPSVHTGDGPIDADAVIVTVPPPQAADLVEAWRTDLADVERSPVVAVHLGWARGSGPAFRGFGWLTPGSERRDVLGMIGVSATFPHLAPDHDLVRVMIGGARAPTWVDQDDAALSRHALGVVREVHGSLPDPALCQVARHRVGIPQYTAGHAARRVRVERATPAIHPLGWGLTGIGVSQGLEAAESLAARLITAS